MHEIHFIQYQYKTQQTTRYIRLAKCIYPTILKPNLQTTKSFVSELSKQILIRGVGNRIFLPPVGGGPPLRGGLTDKLSDNPHHQI